MPNDLSIFFTPKYKEILAELRDLLSQNRIAFLFGAGSSRAAGLPLMHELTTQVMQGSSATDESKKVFESIIANYSGSHQATIEDYMSELVDYLSIADRRISRGVDIAKIAIGNNEFKLTDLADSLAQIKIAIVESLRDKQIEVSYHRQFIRAIHSSLQAGKGDRIVHYFVLNYDTLIEDALGLEKIKYVDGFSGGATAWWDPTTFLDKNIRARIFKIHGSIDWRLLKSDSLPRRVREGLLPDTGLENILIYPAETKYKEAQRDPFAQLIQQMRGTLRPIRGKEMVLAICGYGFSDAHINLEIETALAQSDGRLTIVAFTGEDEPQGVLAVWLANPVLADQIKVYANKGFFHTENIVRSDTDLPWWKFEMLARLLGGER